MSANNTDTNIKIMGFQPRNDSPIDLEIVARLNSHEKKEFKTITNLYDITFSEKLMLEDAKKKALDVLYGILLKEKEITNELVRLDTARNRIIFEASNK